MKKLLVLFVLFVFCVPAYSWDGYDYENDSYIEIGKGNLVRRGREIEVYDWGNGEYRNYEVENIQRYGDTVELEVYDPENDEYRVFEMN